MNTKIQRNKDYDFYYNKLVVDKADIDTIMNNLPKYSLTITQQYAEITQQCANAHYNANKLKLELSVVEADTLLEKRKLLEAAGEKVTEARLGREIKLDKRLIEVIENLDKAKYEVEIWMGLKEAFSQRSTLLGVSVIK